MKTVMKQGVLVKRLKKNSAKKTEDFLKSKAALFRKIGAENEEFRDLVKSWGSKNAIGLNN
jgi:hypothetical protein